VRAPNTKVCSGCHHYRTLNEYHGSRGSSDGLSPVKKTYYRKHRARILEYHRVYYERNREKVLEYGRK
jgi:hypothetical protein